MLTNAALELSESACDEFSAGVDIDARVENQERSIAEDMEFDTSTYTAGATEKPQQKDKDARDSFEPQFHPKLRKDSENARNADGVRMAALSAGCAPLSTRTAASGNACISPARQLKRSSTLPCPLSLLFYGLGGR